VKWRRGAGLDQVEDRRGRGGGLGGIPLPVGGGGVLGLVVLLAYLFLGGGGSGGFPIDPGVQAFPQAPAPQQGAPLDADADETSLFVAAVVDDVQTTWKDIFERAGRTYESTRLVLFDDAVQTGCGGASSATGPFYCPADRKVYLDLSFFRELSARLGAPGDFAQAYVIAHEFGHHVQNVMGVFADVESERRANPEAANELSVRTELQADCLAGVWGHSAYAAESLQAGDLEEGLAAAASVGDDRLQRQAGGQVTPESWTHGSSEQRVTWFRKGFESGDPGACDTFTGDV
jgi:predicted metalloprotease